MRFKCQIRGINVIFFLISYIPSEKNSYIVMVRMLVRLRVDGRLPLAKAFECIISVMTYVQSFLCMP